MQTRRYNEDQGKLLDIPQSNKNFREIAQNFIAILLIFQIALSQNASQSLTTAVCGGDFGDQFLSSFSNSVVNLAQADLQTLIGDRYNGANALLNGGEGSMGHVLEHALLGCVAGAALGGSCEASAAAAAISALHAGAVDPDQALRNSGQAIALAELFGGLAAAIVSGGDTNATMIASGIAGSAFQNNYLNHAEAEQRANAERDLAQCRASGTCSAEEMAGLEQTIAEWNAVDAQRYQALTAACTAAPASPACLGLVREAMEFGGLLGGDLPVIGQTNTADYFNSSLMLADFTAINGDGGFDDLVAKYGSITAEQASTIALLDGFSASRDLVNNDHIWQMGLDGFLTVVGAGSFGNGGAKGGGDIAIKPTTRAEIDAALRPNGELLGEVWGRNRSEIRTVSPSEFLVIRDTLLKGAKPSEPYGNTGQGQWFDLPSGGRVGVRESIETGQTLDIRIPGYSEKLKVHQNVK